MVGKDEAFGLWRQHGPRLVYIVCRSVQPLLCMGVALRLDDEHIFFEINDKEPMGHQRGMYKHPAHLRHFALGPSSAYCWQGSMVRCYNPEDAVCYALDRVYAAVYYGGAKEVTFTVGQDRHMVIW